MARPKKTKETKEESLAKKELRAFIDKLKESNPAAYAKNEASLTNQLNQL